MPRSCGPPARDRLGNLLYGGDLYKGFLDLDLALTDAPTPNSHLSIGVAPFENQAWTLRTYAATVLVAMPTQLDCGQSPSDSPPSILMQPPAYDLHTKL